MSVFDPYIFQILAFLPLAAAIFITLIPTVDTGSKLTVSRFFAVLGLIVFIRILMLFLENELKTEMNLSLTLINFNINLILHVNKYNLFLYGAATASLVTYFASYEINDTKSNIHQTAPFILTFLLYMALGQTDLRVALPILSAANFLVYFLIGFTDKIRRGSTIFQTGIFLFSADALALVLMQIPYSQNNALVSFAVNALFLVPGLSRTCMPMFAPFTKKLFLNIDDAEGPFLMVFLQLSGFLILIMAKMSLLELSDTLSTALGCMAIIGAVYISLLAVTDHNIKNMPYYFLVFYSSLSATILFISTSEDLWFYSLSLLLTTIACFFQTARFAILFTKYCRQESHLMALRSGWLINMAMMMGLPGLGLGTSLWAVFYKLILLNLIPDYDSIHKSLWAFITIMWLGLLSVISYVVIKSVREEFVASVNQELEPLEKGLIFKNQLLPGSVIVAIVSWIIPFIIFYTAKT